MRGFIFTLSTVLTVLLCLNSTQLKAQESYTELGSSGAFSSKRALSSERALSENRAEVTQLGDLTIFSNAAQFNRICNSLQSEDFADTIAPPDSIAFCPSPFNSSTNNDCFTPGALIDGFSLIGLPFASNGGLVVVTPLFFDIPDVLAGPDDFNDNGEITFLNAGAQAAGLHIYTFAADATIVDIDIFGPGNILLGSTSIRATPDGPFFGVQSANSPITRISFTNGYGELFTNLSFGECTLATNIPTMSEWGLIVMAAALGIIGYVVFSRRKRAA